MSIGFDDGTFREIDFSPILEGELYGPLRDLRLFNQVRLDAEVHTLVWPNGADFDPATLHDWPSHTGEVTSALEHWRQKNETASKTVWRAETPLVGQFHIGFCAEFGRWCIHRLRRPALQS